MVPATEVEMFAFLGLAEILSAYIPFLMFLLYWGIPIYCVVKLYKLLSSINDNLAGIRQETERIGTKTP
jgi:hypothetical protein